MSREDQIEKASKCLWMWADGAKPMDECRKEATALVSLICWGPGSGVSGTVPPDEQHRRDRHEALVSSHAARGKDLEHKENLIRMKDRDRAELARMLKAWLDRADPAADADLINRTNAAIHMHARGMK
jgi:hypothetical protein